MPQTVTIAQALQSNLSGLTVQDSAANIAAALPNAGLVARISLFELSGPATIGTAAADQFAALGSKFAAGYALAVQDSVAAMIAGANAAGLALASSRGIIDAAYNLLAAPQADFVHITSVTLTGTPTLSAAQLIKLESLPGFTIAPAAHFTFTDTLAAAAPVLVAHAGWFGAATAVVVRLDGSQVSAGVAVALAALANASKIVTFTPVGLNTTLNVNAAAHDLAGAAASLNRIGLLVGVHITVSNDGSAISAADAVALTTITGFAPAQHTLTVSDTGSAITAAGAALFNHGYPQIVVASGTFSGIAAELLDPTLRIMAGASVSMTGNPTLAAAQIQVLASLPGFAVAQGATLTVSDTITHILAHAGAMAPASTIVATDSESITAANLTTLGQIAAAHPGHFNLAGHTLSVTDSPANLAALGGQAIALTGSYTLNANGLVTAAQLVTLRDGLGVTANGHSVTVSDTATNLLAVSGNLALVSATQLIGDANVNAAQAQSLAGQPGFSVGGHALTITDNAAALLALAGGVQALGHMVLAGSQSVSASQVIALAALGSAFSTSGASLTVTDTANALLALPVGVNALASAYALSASAFVSASQFTSLYSPLHVALNGFTLSVTDTPANLLTIPSQALGQANAFALGAGGTVSEAQFLTLRDILHVGANGHSLTLTDTAASLLTLSGSLALVGATQLSADAIVTASQAQTLAGDPNFSTAAHQLTIADSAANLLGLSNGVASLSGHLVLNADQNVSAAQAAGLVSLGSVFSTASHALIVTDTPAALLGLAPGVTTIATGYALDADGTVSAAGYTALTFGLDVTLNGHGLTVSDTPANLLGLTFPGEAAGFSLSASGTVSEAQFVTLRDTLGVVANGHSLTLADTAADLLALAGNLSLDGATQLTADASVTAAQAITLASDPGFSTGGHVLRVVDSAANLLALPVGVQTLSGHLILATGQSVSAAQAAALAAFGTGFSTNGNTLTVSDSAANLLALPVGVAAIAGAYVLNTDATVSASDFVTLISTLHLGLNGNMLTVSDTPANLLGLPGQLLSHASALCLSAGGTVSESQFLTLRDTLGVAGSGHTLSVLDNAANLLALSGDLSLIGTTTLNGPANVTAAQATILAGEPGFSAGTQVLTVTDTAANLLGLAAGVQSLSGHLVLNASQIVTAAQLTALAALGSAFSTHGATLTVTDTAAALLALSPGAGALAGAFALGANAVVTAAQFAILAGSLDVGLAGHSLTVSDTPANLLAVPAQLLGQASGFSLSAGGTVSEAQFVTLRDVVGVVGNANLLIVADTASNLLALSGNLALIGATQLSTNANVSAAQAQGLAGEPAFSLGGNTLTIADTAANLLALSSGVQTLSGHLLLTASQSVTASQITALAALGSIFSTGGATLTVSDTAAALVGLSPSALALAGAYALSADASVNAAQFATLYGTLHVSLAGHALSVSDTPVNLLAVPLQALSHATGFSLSAGGTVNENQFAFLRDTMGVAGNGHTLTVTDTAANLLSLSGNLALVGGTQLAAAANLNAAQATTLAGEPAFATGGYVLSVTDNAANLLGLATGVQTLSGHLVLAGSQSVSGAQATGLAALGGAFSLGGTTLTVTDSAANLLSLPLGVTAIVGAYALNGNATVTEAQFVTLRDNLAVNVNGHTLVVSDTAADLLALSGNLAMDSATLLSADASVTAAQAISLAADPAFATAGHILTITDTAANLLALPTLVQMLAGHLVLASSQSVSAAQASALAALGSSFSTGSNTLTVSDSAANLLAVPLGVAAIAGAYLLTSDATVNAAQFTTLRDSLHIGLNGHAITILDNAGNLAGLSGNLADASACLLSANGTVSAAAAAILNGEPGFSNAGHTLTIADTVTNLLGLSAPLQSLVNAFTLSANQVASAAQLAGLAAYGIKFTDGAATLGVADTAANLAGLTAPELALVNAETMTQSATISAAMASTLVGLPGFSLGSGVFMTVQDSAANLAALPWNVLAVASMEMLPPGPVTLSAAQAASLYLLQHFSAAGATITVQDSVAALSNNSNWSPIATYTHVVDTAGNLAANAGLELLQNANAVTLAGNATIGAAQAASLASIGGYSTGSNTLTVADSAPAIAQNEAAINAVASTAVVDSTAPVSAAQADCLASLANANKLVFQAGDTLSIVDSFAALTSNTNVSGLALASNITINDTAANLAVAASHDWGNVFPTYVLSGDAVINGAQAVALAGLGSHLLLNGHHLAVQDTAANVVADAAALTSLGISATVIDQAAAVGGQATALAGLGGRLAAVLVTDINPLAPVTAATLAPLASKLAGLPIAVAGNAAAIDANIGALHTLGAHIAISLTDSASAVGAYAADLATLGAALAISLTDATPVSATTAAALSALTTRFVAGTFLAVSDTAGDIASQTATLVAMGNAIGAVSLIGGSGVSVVQAAALLGLQNHLGVGVQLAVSGPAADIAANLSALLALQMDGRLASLTDAGESIAAVAAISTALNELGATVDVSDTLANFNGGVANLAGITGLAAVSITDSVHPVFALSLAQYSAEASLLARLTNAHTVAITDTAGAIEADLASPSSVLASIAGPLSLAVTNGAPLVLSQAVALTAGVAAILADFTGNLKITGVDIADLGAVAALSPHAITIADTTAAIGADLASGSSLILADNTAISSIVASGGGNISLTAAQALSANVDDGVNSALAKLTGAGLVVTGATVAQIALLEAATVVPSAISINDTAANITAALINPASSVMNALSSILTLHVNDAGAITLTAAQDTAAGVNDSASAALTKLTGGTLDVTDVTTSNLGVIESGARTPDHILIADSGTDIAAAIGVMLLDRLNLGPITVTSGNVILSVAQATTAHVADGPGSLVSLLPGHSYGVSGAAVGDIATLTALAQAPSTIAVSDSSDNVAADISSAISQVATHANSVSVTGGILSLTDAQAHGVIAHGNIAALDDMQPGQTIDITGVPVADIADFASIAGGLPGGVTLHLEVSDTALALANDLDQNVASLLIHDAAFVNSVTLSGAGGILNAAQLSEVAGLPGLNGNGITVPVSDTASNIAGLGAGARALAGTNVTVVDSLGVLSNLLGTLQATYDGHLTITLTDPGSTVGKTPGEFSALLPTIDAITTAACIIVTGNAAGIAAIAPTLASDRHVAAVQVHDSAANVVSNLSAIASLGNAVTVELTDWLPISAALAQALVNQNLAHLAAWGITVADTGAQIAAMAESGAADVAFLIAQGSALTTDSNLGLIDAQAIVALQGSISTSGHALNVWDTVANLTAPGAAALLSTLIGSTLFGGVYLRTTGGTVNVTVCDRAVCAVQHPGPVGQQSRSQRQCHYGRGTRRRPSGAGPTRIGQLDHPYQQHAAISAIVATGGAVISA